MIILTGNWPVPKTISAIHIVKAYNFPTFRAWFNIFNFFFVASVNHTLGDSCLRRASSEDSRASAVAINTLVYALPHPYKYLGAKCPLSVSFNCCIESLIILFLWVKEKESLFLIPSCYQSFSFKLFDQTLYHQRFFFSPFSASGRCTPTPPVISFSPQLFSLIHGPFWPV